MDECFAKCKHIVPPETRGGCWSLEGAMVGSELPCGCWETNPGPLVVQPVLLAAEPKSLQSDVLVFFFLI